LKTGTGDVTLLFLVQNGVLFFEQAVGQDEWHRVQPNQSGQFAGLLMDGEVRKIPLHFPEEAASPLACLDQFQFCLADSDHCGPLTGWSDAAQGAAPIFGIPEDRFWDLSLTTWPERNGANLIWYTTAMQFGNLNTLGKIVVQQTASPLLSSQSVMSGIQVAMPGDQWQRDMRHWWQTWLAGLQMLFVAAATGPNNPSMEPHLIRPEDEAQRDFCNSQVRGSSTG